MGCQHAVVDAIVAKPADYIIAVKNNQPTLAQAIEGLFEANDRGELEQALPQVTVVDKSHGRIETRQCVVAHDVSALSEVAAQWRGLRSVGRIRSTREIVNGRAKGEAATEWRYYISSTQLSPERFEAAVRAHWGIENQCHWVLDMTFSEDDCRIRVGDGAENFAILRRMSLNLLKQEKSKRPVSTSSARRPPGARSIWRPCSASARSRGSGFMQSPWLTTRLEQWPAPMGDMITWDPTLTVCAIWSDDALQYALHIQLGRILIGNKCEHANGCSVQRRGSFSSVLGPV